MFVILLVKVSHYFKSVDTKNHNHLLHIHRPCSSRNNTMTVFGSLQSLVALLLITLSPLLLSSTTSAFPIITDVDESYTKVSSSRGWCASQLCVGIADVGVGHSYAYR